MDAALMNRAILARNISLVTYWLLLVTLIATTFVGDLPEEASKLTILAIKLVPLLILLPGLLKHRTRSHVWLCFIILLYFTSASTQLVITNWAILPVVMSVMSVVIFFCSMMYVNWYGKARTRTPDGQPS